VAIPVVEVGHLCGFRVVVVDDRADMVGEDRFPNAAERIAGDIVEALRTLSITPCTYVVIITRGHAYDEAALRAIIDSPAGYIGMIGSRRKVRITFDHLRADGVEEALIGRVHAPIGLEIGAQTPAEIAVSILAEIIVQRKGQHSLCPDRRGKPMKLEP
jgi:xanthine dehydrogenase accessory factor